MILARLLSTVPAALPGVLRIVRMGLVAAVLGGIAMPPGVAHAATRAAESQLKAAFIVKFLSYVEWPALASPDPATPLRIGVLEDDDVADELAGAVAGRTVNGQPVAVQRLRRDDPLTDLNVLFIGRAAGANLSSTIAAANARGVLTITDSDQAFALGSVINFVVVDGRLRFDVAPQHADSNKLRISSRLLTVARKVV